jgi:hypothetical protein
MVLRVLSTAAEAFAQVASTSEGCTAEGATKIPWEAAHWK